MKNRMALGKQLTANFAATLVVTALLGGFLIVDSGDLQRILEREVNASARRTDLIGQLTTSLAEMKGARQLLIAGDASTVEQRRSLVRASSANVDRLLAGLDPLITEARERKLLETLRNAHHSWAANHSDLTMRCADCHTPGAVSMEGGNQQHGQMERASEGLAQMQRDSLAAASREVEASVARSRWIAIGLGGMAAALCAWILWVVRRSMKSLRKTTLILSEGSTQAVAGAKQVKDASAALAQNAEQQSRNVGTTSSTAEELAAMTQKNAELSNQSAALMARVEEGVQAANSTLRSLQVSMDEIAASSGKVSGIIKVIDGIAFQTNILALNAAVEAARAGESGLGFAVVADEVRNLAQRSADAARDTGSLIDESAAKSLEGRARLDEVIKSIEEITGRSTEVKALVDGVSMGSQEQAKGIEEIARAVRQMEQQIGQVLCSGEDLTLAGRQISAQTTNVENGVARLQAMVDGTRSSRSGDG
jgi:methyl-accepting chemotaxis protein/methyl-accepting chemotaxis protein-1 (serine sensor receptor)